MQGADGLLIAADVNAVPPAGIEGLAVNANGDPLEATKAVGIGPLAIGNVKYKVEFGLFKKNDRSRQSRSRSISRMRFPLHARSPNSAGSLLIAAISGRALAAAARRAGYRPLVADFFCDTDTVALAERAAKLPGDLQHGIDGARMVETLQRLAGSDRPVAIVLGSGFERRPELVDEIARHFPLAGNGAAAIRRVKDPQIAGGRLRRTRHPASGIPAGSRRPIRKTGWSRRPAAPAARMSARANGERAGDQAATSSALLSGDSVSALFVGDGERRGSSASAGNGCRPAPAAPYRYGGAVRLRRFDRQDAATIGGWLSGLTRARRPGRAVQRRLHPRRGRLPAHRDQSAARRHARHFRQRRRAA